jgi:hypothetical protein
MNIVPDQREKMKLLLDLIAPIIAPNAQRVMTPDPLHAFLIPHPRRNEK